MLKVVAIQIADSIDIRQFRTFYAVSVHYADSDELFYQTDTEKFIYVFKYGITCFLGYSETEIATFQQLIAPYCKNIFTQPLNDEFDIETDAPHTRFGYNKIELERATVETLRLVMLNVSQSVALDHFSGQTDILLEETNYHTQILEKKGKLELSGARLKKYIGRTLNLKNKIGANLYIFDSPEETWEDENLNKMDIGLKKTFDLQARFRTIREGLEIVKENLELFKDMLQYRNTILLEWVIIILIFVEVMNLVIEKISR